VLGQLDQAQSTQQVLQLLDVWGNVCKPAAAKLAACLPTSAQAAIGGGLQLTPRQSRQQQQQGHGEEDAPAVSDKYALTPEQQIMLRQLAQGDFSSQPPAKRQRTKRSGQQAAATSDGADDADHRWQLQLFLEVPGAAGAAINSKAAAAAAAAGEEARVMRLITPVPPPPFDADGCCTVPALSLREQLGITSVGEYRLLGKAAPVGGGAAASSSSSSGGLPAGSQLVLQLGSWHVVSEGTKELTQRQVAVKKAQRDLEQRVKRADALAGQQQAARQGAQAALNSANAVVKLEHKRVMAGTEVLRKPPAEQLQQAAQAAAQQQRLLAGLGVGNRGSQPLLEHPWVRQHAGGQAQRLQQLAARPCQAHEVCLLSITQRAPRPAAHSAAAAPATA
jgi:hypothetical protein